MPNNIKNRLVIKSSDEQVKEVLDFLRGEPYSNGAERYIDFNKIIPMPEELNIESGSKGNTGMEYLLACAERYDFSGKYKGVKEKFETLSLERQKKYIELGAKYLKNIANYGFKTWYDWCVENWGTKWNAYSQSLENENEIWFETAWSCVIDLIEKLSIEFPGVEFDYTWAGEDTGRKCGKCICINGYCDSYIPDSGSSDAYEIAFELRPYYRDCYELVDGEYRYKEEEFESTENILENDINSKKCSEN